MTEPVFEHTLTGLSIPPSPRPSSRPSGASSNQDRLTPVKLRSTLMGMPLATREFTRTLRVQRRSKPERSARPTTPARHARPETRGLRRRRAEAGSELGKLWRSANPVQRLLLVSIGCALMVLSAIIVAQARLLLGL